MRWRSASPAASTRLANPDGSTRDRDFNKAPRRWPASATAGGAVSFAETLIRAPDRPRDRRADRRVPAQRLEHERLDCGHAGRAHRA